MDRRIYEERQHVPISSNAPIVASGGMIVHQQAARVSNHPTLRLPVGSATTTQFTDNGPYTWQQTGLPTTAHNAYDPQMYYTNEIFSTTATTSDTTHLKGATIIEPPHMKGPALHHDISIGGHPMHVSHGINVLQPGTIVVASSGVAPNTPQITAAVATVQPTVHQISVPQPISVASTLVPANNTATPSTKKKKRPVKSKKKQISKDDDMNECNDASVYPDDVVYIRVSCEVLVVVIIDSLNNEA